MLFITYLITIINIILYGVEHEKNNVNCISSNLLSAHLVWLLIVFFRLI